jgi:GT2 family glycosyltransferase
MIDKSKICAIVLNWKGPKQTIECVESLRVNCNVNTIIVDNDSQDDSMSVLSAYLDSLPDRSSLVATESELKHIGTQFDYALVSNSGNYGYAGDNNVALDYAYRAGYEYFWILNNDVIVEAGALKALLETLESDPDCGFAASVLVYADRPDFVQSIGGGTNYPLLGKTKLLGKNTARSEIKSVDLNKLDYVMGASMLVSRNVIATIGLMEHRYFMYSEEIDWQNRAAERGIGFKVSKNSFVRHGDSGSTKDSSHMFHFYRNRASIMYNKRFHSIPFWMISSLALSAVTIIQNRKNLKNIRYGLKGVAQGVAFSW